MRTPKEEAIYLIQFFKSYAFFDVRLDIIHYKNTVLYNAKIMAEYMVKTIINELEFFEETNIERLNFYKDVLDEINIYTD
jgi:hypothetical protein